MKNVFRKMCVMICENDFSNTPEEKSNIKYQQNGDRTFMTKQELALEVIERLKMGSIRMRTALWIMIMHGNYW